MSYPGYSSIFITFSLTFDLRQLLLRILKVATEVSASYKL